MKFLRAMLPHITIALNLSVLVILYLENRNPMMGFFMGIPISVLLILTALSSTIMAILVYSDWRRRHTDRSKDREDERKI